jgi:beta-glucosidase
VFGVETAQCYVGFKINNDSEPKKTLQGFKKIELNSGNKSEVEIILDKRSFSSWNEADRNWEVRSGSYEILIGSSAEKILLQTTIGL